ncbi:MAG: FHA domain-containing protein [Erysipelotrichaceae bacterium]|nr:FHA domain-containing protein [Erysipelotrichaceae bacterium]
MRIHTEVEGGRFKARVYLSFFEFANQKELMILKDSYLIGFLKPEFYNLIYIDYYGTDGISLNEYMKNPMTKNDFYYLMMQIVLATKSLKSIHLSLENMVLDLSNIYINEVDKKIQFLYVPTKKNVTSYDMMGFLRSLVYSIIPNQMEQTEYLNRFGDYLKTLKDYDADIIQSYLLKENRSLLEMVKKHQFSQKGNMNQRLDIQKDDDDITQRLDQDMPDQIEEEGTVLLEEDATSYLDVDKTTLLVEDEPTGLLNPISQETFEEDLEEETVDLRQYLNTQQYPIQATITRISTNETIKINKAVFRIGKSKSCADYAVSDNKAVSKIHADIIKRGSDYFIVDQESKNQTFINEAYIQPKYEVELHDGDHIRLANEDFIFHYS